jgi:endoglucanase
MPGNEKKQVGETKVGSGPVVFRGPNINPHVHERLVAAATAKEITIQVRGVPRATGTDANAMQLARAGVAAALVSIPNRYMHSPVEVVSLVDLDNAAKLLAQFCAGVTSDMSWIP